MIVHIHQVALIEQMTVSQVKAIAASIIMKVLVKMQKTVTLIQVFYFLVICVSFKVIDDNYYFYLFLISEILCVCVYQEGNY